MASKAKITTVKPQPHHTKSGNHPTRDRLLHATVELMSDHLPQSITSEMVLQKSGISRGSLYHHFSDFSELLELAMVGAFALSVDKTLAAFNALLDTAKSRDDLLKGLFVVTERTQSPKLKTLRFQRVRLIAFSEDNPRLAASLAVEQQRLTDAITDLIREAQERGWMSKTFDPRSAAVLIQAYTLGKIVDDVVPTQMSEQHWNDLINTMIEKVLCAN